MGPLESMAGQEDRDEELSFSLESTTDSRTESRIARARHNKESYSGIHYMIGITVIMLMTLTNGMETEGEISYNEVYKHNPYVTANVLGVLRRDFLHLPTDAEEAVYECASQKSAGEDLRQANARSPSPSVDLAPSNRLVTSIKKFVQKVKGNMLDPEGKYLNVLSVANGTATVNNLRSTYHHYTEMCMTSARAHSLIGPLYTGGVFYTSNGENLRDGAWATRNSAVPVLWNQVTTSFPRSDGMIVLGTPMRLCGVPAGLEVDDQLGQGTTQSVLGSKRTVNFLKTRYGEETIEIAGRALVIEPERRYNTLFTKKVTKSRDSKERMFDAYEGLPFKGYGEFIEHWWSDMCYYIVDPMDCWPFVVNATDWMERPELGGLGGLLRAAAAAGHVYAGLVDYHLNEAEQLTRTFAEYDSYTAHPKIMDLGKMGSLRTDFTVIPWMTRDEWEQFRNTKWTIPQNDISNCSARVADRSNAQGEFLGYYEHWMVGAIQRLNIDTRDRVYAKKYEWAVDLMPKDSTLENYLDYNPHEWSPQEMFFNETDYLYCMPENDLNTCAAGGVGYLWDTTNGYTVDALEYNVERDAATTAAAQGITKLAAHLQAESSTCTGSADSATIVLLVLAVLATSLGGTEGAVLWLHRQVVYFMQFVDASRRRWNAVHYVLPYSLVLALSGIILLLTPVVAIIFQLVIEIRIESYGEVLLGVAAEEVATNAPNRTQVAMGITVMETICADSKRDVMIGILVWAVIFVLLTSGKAVWSILRLFWQYPFHVVECFRQNKDGRAWLLRDKCTSEYNAFIKEAFVGG